MFCVINFGDSVYFCLLIPLWYSTVHGLFVVDVIVWLLFMDSIVHILFVVMVCLLLFVIVCVLLFVCLLNRTGLLFQVLISVTFIKIGSALNIDLRQFYTQLYEAILQLDTSKLIIFIVQDSITCKHLSLITIHS